MNKRAILTAMVLLVISPLAYANVGTPVMLTGAFHLLIGNTLIGIFEGILIAWVFKQKFVRCILNMVGANYFSTWVGSFLFDQYGFDYWGIDLTNGGTGLFMMILLAYLLTLFLEYPLVATCFTSKGKWFKRSLQASMLVQSLSYIVFLGGYWLISSASLFSVATVVTVTEIMPHKTVTIFYISEGSGNVCQIPPFGAEGEIFELDKGPKTGGLVIKSDSRRNHFLMVSNYNYPTGQDREVLVRDVTTGCLDSGNFDPAGQPIERSPYGVTVLGSGRQSIWDLESGVWAIEGLGVKNRVTGEEFNIALETPFVAWSINHVSLLPNDQVVFQLGGRQICLLDLPTRKISLLAHGRCPRVILQDPELRPKATNSRQKD